MSAARSLAFFSILRPRRMGIADYGEDLLAELVPRFDVTAYVPAEDATALSERAGRFRAAQDYTGREASALFQIGNGTELAFQLPALLRHGGVATLHDACQYDLTWPYFSSHRWRFALEALRSLEGEARRELLAGGRATPSRMLERAFARYQTHPRKRQLFPFTPFVLRRARAAVVHSRFLERRVSELRPGLPVTVIPHGVHLPPPAPRAERRRRLRQQLGVEASERTLLLVSFGAIQAHKRIDAVLRSLNAFAAEGGRFLYLLVGPRDSEYDLDAALAGSGIADRVRVLDSYLAVEDVELCLGAADLCFSLRFPSLGSTSGALMKAFAAGCPAVVSAVDAFAETSPEAAFAVPPPPGAGESQGCLEALRVARDHPERLAAMGAAARRVAEGCAWPEVGARYQQVLEDVVKR